MLVLWLISLWLRRTVVSSDYVSVGREIDYDIVYKLFNTLFYFQIKFIFILQSYITPVIENTQSGTIGNLADHPNLFLPITKDIAFTEV